MTREVVIERADFEMEPPRGYKRLAPGRAVRLRHGPVVRVDEVETDDAGNPTRLSCHAFLDDMGSAPEGVKVWSTVHWVSRPLGVPMTARLYGPLFDAPDPEADGANFLDHVDPGSLVENRGLVEPSVLGDDPDTRYQFERLGYFWRDPVDGRGDDLVFNRIVPLKDGYGRRAVAAGADVRSTPELSVDDERAGDRVRGAGSGGRQGASDPSREVVAAAASGAPDPARYERAERLATAHGLTPSDADALASSEELVAFFERVMAHDAPTQAAANLVVNEVARELRERGDRMGLTPAGVAGTARLLSDGTITATAAKEVLAEAAASGADPVKLVSARGLDAALPEAEVRRLALEALERHPDEVTSYRAGKLGLRGFFIGQVMRSAGGRADPQVVQRVVAEVLG